MYRGTDAYTHADRHADAYTNGNADSDTNSVSDGNANAHRNADAQPDPDTYAGRDLHADAHRYRGVCGQFGRVPIDHGRPGIGDSGYGRLCNGAAELLGGKRDERECVDPGVPVQHDKPSYGHIYEAKSDAADRLHLEGGFPDAGGNDPGAVRSGHGFFGGRLAGAGYDLLDPRE